MGKKGIRVRKQGMRVSKKGDGSGSDMDESDYETVSGEGGHTTGINN